jgi:ferredoxin-like protein FixX
VHASTEDKTDDIKDSFYKALERVLDHLPKLPMKMLSEFNAKVERERKRDIFKSTTGDESLYESSNDNGVRVINFDTSKCLNCQVYNVPHRNTRKYTWTYSGGKIHSHTDYVLI